MIRTVRSSNSNLGFEIEARLPFDLIDGEVEEALVQHVLFIVGATLSGAGRIEDLDARRQYITSIAQLASDLSTKSITALSAGLTAEFLSREATGEFDPSIIFGEGIDG